MEIYVVQPNDTIYSIASKFNVPAKKIVRDNELEFPHHLVPGQTIVIVYPKESYLVKEGDTIESVAKDHNVSQMQLLRNNPFLSELPLYPGEYLTISYNTTGSITTGGYIYPYIDRDILKKTLPYLTYVTVYNYRAVDEGKVISYSDDMEVIKIAKEYGTIPLMMATTMSAHGEPDIETAYGLLLNETYQENFVNNTVSIMKEKGYLGINIVFKYMNVNSQHLYENMITKFINKLDDEGFLFFVTINPTIKYVNNELVFDKIDYSKLGESINRITFLQFIWGTNYGPPLPVNSMNKLNTIVDYAVSTLDPKKILVGYSLISYDWLLPYIPGNSYANALSLNSALRLAQDVGATIEFDDISQSPFFNYIQGAASEHIVWSVDARSIEALMQLITNEDLCGAGFWNLMVYTAQLWLVINSQFEIIKLIPSKFDS